MTDPTVHKSIPENIFAYTAPGTTYPGYVSINRDANGDVSVTVRSAGTGPHKGVRVCRNRADATGWDCYPGGPGCNNYCNMAPQKGPMQDRPESIEYYKEGVTSEFTVPASEWCLK